MAEFENRTSFDPHPSEDAGIPQILLENSLLICTLCFTLWSSVVLLSPSSLRLFARVLSYFEIAYEKPGPAGCKRIGIPRQKSNLLNDEYDPKYASGDENGNGKSWKVKSLWIYPVKSCGGVELEEATVVKTGLLYDRMFSFGTLKRIPTNNANAHKSDGPTHRWEFATQRTLPRMANVHTEMWVPDPSTRGYSEDLPAVQTGGVIRVSFPWRRQGWRGVIDQLEATMRGQLEPTMSFTLPYAPTPEQIKRDYTLEPFKIWNEVPQGINMSQHVPSELKQYLGASGQFAVFRTSEPREVFRDAPRKETLGWQPVAAFNDAYPLNLLGLSSLQQLDSMQPEGSPRLSARRFRANVLVEGTPPYAEEDWKYATIGDDEYYCVARCVRCKLPNVDPDTGEKHRQQPDATIRAFRQVDPGAPKGTGCLAVQMVPRLECGKMRVGDVIEVKERGDLVYTPMGL